MARGELADAFLELGGRHRNCGAAAARATASAGESTGSGASGRDSRDNHARPSGRAKSQRVDGGGGRLGLVADGVTDADGEPGEQQRDARRGGSAVGVDDRARGDDAAQRGEGGDGPQLGIGARRERIPEDDVGARRLARERLEQIAAAEPPRSARRRVRAVGEERARGEAGVAVEREVGGVLRARASSAPRSRSKLTISSARGAGGRALGGGARGERVRAGAEPDVEDARAAPAAARRRSSRRDCCDVEQLRLAQRADAGCMTSPAARLRIGERAAARARPPRASASRVAHARASACS